MMRKKIILSLIYKTSRRQESLSLPLCVSVCPIKGETAQEKVFDATKVKRV